MNNPTNEDARKEELVKELAENLSVEQLGIALAFGRNLAMYGLDVTSAWKTATEQSAALQAAYHRGLSDGMLFNGERSAASALQKSSSLRDVSQNISRKESTYDKENNVL